MQTGYTGVCALCGQVCVCVTCVRGLDRTEGISVSAGWVYRCVCPVWSGVCKSGLDRTEGTAVCKGRHAELCVGTLLEQEAIRNG